MSALYRRTIPALYLHIAWCSVLWEALEDEQIKPGITSSQSGAEHCFLIMKTIGNMKHGRREGRTPRPRWSEGKLLFPQINLQLCDFKAKQSTFSLCFIMVINLILCAGSLRHNYVCKCSVEHLLPVTNTQPPLQPSKIHLQRCPTADSTNCPYGTGGSNQSQGGRDTHHMRRLCVRCADHA